MHRFSVALAVTVIIAAPTAVRAQGTLSADEKELAAYTLTMPALKKMGAALTAASEAMARDPRYQPLMKLGNDISAREKELEKLQAKDDLTQAEQLRSEALSEQIEKLNAEYEAEEEKLAPSTDAATLSEMEQAIRANPIMANAIAHEGLSPREYAKVSLTMLQAGMAYAISQKVKDFKLPAGVNPANVKFVGDHKAEIEALQKQFSSMGRVQQK